MLIQKNGIGLAAYDKSNITLVRVLPQCDQDLHDHWVGFIVDGVANP